jgi:lipopolysaccharide export system permease protein
LLDARTDLATTLIKPGEFTSIGKDLTFYARENRGGLLRGLLISDTRDADDTADFIAETGRIAEVAGTPTLILTTGEIHQIETDGSLSILLFDQYPFDLTEFLREGTDIVLKASDRYLPQLVRLDPTNYFDTVAKHEFRAEAHYRLTGPLLNYGIVMLAILAILGGDYSRGGYNRRIGLYSAALAGIIILQLTLQAGAAETHILNLGQWLLPIGLFAAAAALQFTRLSPRRIWRTYRSARQGAS